MEELTMAQRSRLAIRMFMTMADALALRGYYKPSGKSGQTLMEALRMLSPEIYGSMNEPSVIELKGLEYIIERLPRGIEACTQITLTAEEDLEHTSFEKIVPPKRRRSCYRISDKEMAFVITRGLSEIYDILTHLTFLNIEAMKLRGQIREQGGDLTREWAELERTVLEDRPLEGADLDRALWNLGMVLGRTYQETRETYMILEESRRTEQSNDGLFRFVYRLGKRMLEEERSRERELIIAFTPSLKQMIGKHTYGERWARVLQNRLVDLGLRERPLHVISANLHSVLNLLYGYGALGKHAFLEAGQDLYAAIPFIREREGEVLAFAREHGLHEVPDTAWTHIDCQIVDTALLDGVPLHPQLDVCLCQEKEKRPVLLVMDYAFGIQAFEVMDELLTPFRTKDGTHRLTFRSVSVMGKAGTITGKKGDIMLATGHVLEGIPHNYIVANDLKAEDFDGTIDVHVGPIVTVVGTSLQNRDLLQKFQISTWQAVGLEMEGGHYQRAISAAILRGHITADIKVRYAYYASDNPLVSGQTLASGPMGKEGIRPTYMITKVILKKILDG